MATELSEEEPEDWRRHAVSIFIVSCIVVGLFLIVYTETFTAFEGWTEYISGYEIHHPAITVTLRPYWQLGAALIVIAMSAIVLDYAISHEP